jgi:protein TonB
MKSRLIVIFLMMFALFGTMYGQTLEREPQVIKTEEDASSRAISKLKKLNQTIQSNDKMPEFPGGDAALMAFLRSHIHYPLGAAKFGVEGRVVVQFVVQKDGSVTEIKVAKSVDKELDEEAIRVCKLLPKFKPAVVDGEPAAVWYTLPVTFKLQKQPQLSESGDKW